MPATVSSTSPSARQLLLRLLLAADGGALDAAAAIRAGALFGISTNSMRVALTRLQASGRIENVERGSYRLGRATRALGNDVASWRERGERAERGERRDAEQRLRPWQGDWIAVSVSSMSRGDRSAARNRARAFALLGMRALDDGLFIRPDNLTGGVSLARARLQSLGLERDAAVFVASAFDARTETRARRLWKADKLEQGYRNGRKSLQASLGRLPALPLENAARESYLIGDHALRTLVFDPLLPEPLVATAERHAFVDAMLDYDAAGQDIWRRFLALPK